MRTLRTFVTTVATAALLAVGIAFATLSAPAAQTALAKETTLDLLYTWGVGVPVNEVLFTTDIAFDHVDPEEGEEGEGTDVAHSYSFLVSGAPDGVRAHLEYTDTQIIMTLSGTPTTAGEYFVQITQWDDTAGEVTVRGGITIGIFNGPTVSVTTSSGTNLFDDETAKFNVSVSGGTGDYTHKWYVMGSSGSASGIGGDLNYLFYPSSNTKLSLNDDGLTFYCEVTDNITGLSGVSAYTKISVSCRHDFGEWEEKTAATCEEPQVLAHVCSKCGTEETKTGKAATGHTWGDWLQSGSDTMTHICSVCGETETQELVGGTPFIKTQPQGVAIIEDDTATLSVVAEAVGLGNLTYQWYYAAEKDGEASPAPGASNQATYKTSENGWYFVRVTQTAGSDVNTTDSDAVQVHVHTMSVWLVDTAKGTAMRTCLADDCPDYISETITLNEMMELYPEDAEALGLSKFNIFMARHKLLLLVVGVVLMFAIVAVIVLLTNKKRQQQEEARRQAAARARAAARAGAAGGAAAGTSAAGRGAHSTGNHTADAYRRSGKH